MGLGGGRGGVRSHKTLRERQRGRRKAEKNKQCRSGGTEVEAAPSALRQKSKELPQF